LDFVENQGFGNRRGIDSPAAASLQELRGVPLGASLAKWALLRLHRQLR
jgi:hypothetical protein